MNNIIDEIKKNIEQEAYNENFHTKIVQVEDVYKILDKYQDQEDVYKKCWEELKNGIKFNMEHYEQSEWQVFVSLVHMQQLEQKHNIKEVE